MLLRFLIIFTTLLTAGAYAQIVINEINYDPINVTRQEEFIELHNPGVAPVSVAGWGLEDAVDFTFPPGTSIPAGGFVVVAQSLAHFESRYGFAPFGPWGGILNNSGERITIKDHAANVVDEVNYGSGFPWPTGPRGAGHSAELIHPSLDNTLGGSWRSSIGSTVGGSPGATNSCFSTEAPPQIRQVEHTPAQPAAGVPVVVTAKITDPNGTVSATLSYQSVGPGSYIRRTDPAYATTWTDLVMNDAGNNGDFLAGDSIFSATLHAGLQVHRHLMRYRISTTDGTSAITVPYADDEQPNFAYFVYNGVPSWNGAVQPGAALSRGTVQSFSPELLNSMQTWQLITNATDHDNMLYNNSSNNVRFFGTFVYEGKVYDHIRYHNRGVANAYVSGKNKSVLFFNRGRNIRIRDNWGQYFSEEWNSIPITACASPWAAVHRGMAGVEEAFSHRIFELASVPSMRTTYLHLRVIRSAAEVGATQYASDFWGLFMALEPTEGNFLDERQFPDGNVYAIESSSGDKKHQGATHPTDTSDWLTYRNAATRSGQTEEWYRANVDLPTFYTFYALNRLTGNVDMRPGDNHRYYHRSSDNRWLIIPYDLDMMAMPIHHWGGTLDGVVWANSASQSLLLSRHPALALELRNRARELLDLLASDNSVSGGQAAQLVDEYAQLVNPAGIALTWADADEAMWSNHPRTAGGGGGSGYSNHKNNFYRTPYADTRGGLGGVPSGSWTRTLPNAVGGYARFEDQMNYLVSFYTNEWTGATWRRSNGIPAGHGYKYLEFESLYGGWGNINSLPTSADLAFPNTPAITYSGPVGFPSNQLDFTTSEFNPSANGGTTYSAIQWRLAEIYAPGIPGYRAGEPRKYEIEEVWTSGELTGLSSTIRIPLTYAKPSRTYRARVRHKDANGRWSHWSAPVSFIAGTPDVESFASALVVNEINYNPAPVTASEFAAGYTSDDFEWVEIKNTGALPVDMTGVRFTKGIDFDFPASWTIPAGGFALVVRHLAAFQLRYGNSFNGIIAGVTTNNFSNSGERVKLSYGAGTVIVEFTFSDAEPWPVAADGSGKTLSLLNGASQPDPAVAANWKESHATGGSPGGDDLITFSIWSMNFPAATDPLGDTDLDGIQNLVEYALLSNPLASDLGTLPSHTIQSFNVLGVLGDYLVVTFTRRADGSDLTFFPEFAASLSGSWMLGVLESTVPSSANRVTEIWRSSDPLSMGSRQFARLRVVKQ